MQTRAIKANLPWQLVDFIDKNIPGAEICSLPNDLSKRKYYRIIFDKKNYVLMDSILEPNQFNKYIRTTNFLEKANFSVPFIHLIDFENSIALIEDFGDQKANNLLMSVDLAGEKEVYKKSLYLIANLQKINVDKELFPNHHKVILKDGIDKFLDNCVLDFYKDKVENELNKLINDLSEPSIFSHRDFHVDNIMWLSEREGVKKVGLIDFQDLSIGYQAYDVVSLLQDARRFITPFFEKQMIEFYFELINDIDREKFMHEYRILSIQRNLRIFGLFTNTTVEKESSNYTKYLPNVRNYIEREIHNLGLSEKTKTIILHSLS
ncbi:MAG: phosphotransferase [Rickettsiales bacterium]|nr:phosphotransferase [Rickettsiales bacterium]